MFKFLALILVLGALYLTLWPTPVEPQAWDAPSSLGYVGKFEPNQKLRDFTALPLTGLHGPEAAAFDAMGRLYATTHEGWILRWSAAASEPERWVDLGGRPLGVDFDADGNLWVANAYLGLQKISPQGQVATLVTETNGVPVRYADDVVVAPDGKVYFSDASTRFGAKASLGTLEASLLDIMEHSDNGRIIMYDPKSGVSSVVLDGLTFANGVAMDATGEFLLVVETGEYRVHKLWLNGAKAGQSEVIIDNIPGFPDNIHRGLNGRYWIGLTAPRSAILDDLSQKPFVRKIVQRLPASMRPQVGAYGMVIAIDADGQVMENLHAPDGEVFTTTGVAESDDFLFVTSLTAPFLARYAKKDLPIN
ncbi:SMP-30/gluconolactonase/LRE family protein [Arenicella xantha]|nr:SMP-30/gluconolactonase/LRE family protein [Arenicella xantha]